MLHARWVQARAAPAPSRRRTTSRCRVDESSIKNIPGAQVVQVGNFLAVVAPKEYDAIQAAAQLKVVWKSDPKFGSGSGNFWSWLRKAGDTNTTNPGALHGRRRGNVDAALQGAAKTVSATYKYQYNGFMPIGPHARSPTSSKDSAIVYVQGQSLQRASRRQSQHAASNIPAGEHPGDLSYEGSSSYGGGIQCPVQPSRPRSISKQIGKPVRVQWMRWDQHGWDHYGPRHMYDVTMGIDASGKIVGADWTSVRPGQRQPRPPRASWSARPRWAAHAGGRRPDARRTRRSTTRTTHAACSRRRQPLYEGLVQLQPPAGSERAAVVLRQRADRGRARVRGEDGPGRVPAAEHRRHVRRSVHAGCRCSTA